MTLFYSVFTICLLILDGAFRLRVWITRQYFPLICYSFNCQQTLFIYSLPPENICFCLLYSQRDWTRLDPFSAYFSLCCACKIKKYKTPTQKLFGTHSHPVTSLTSFCLPVYFPLYRKYFFVLKNSWRSSRYQLPAFIHLSFKVNIFLFYCLVF